VGHTVQGSPIGGRRRPISGPEMRRFGLRDARGEHSIGGERAEHGRKWIESVCALHVIRRPPPEGEDAPTIGDR